MLYRLRSPLPAFGPSVIRHDYPLSIPVHAYPFFLDLPNLSHFPPEPLWIVTYPDGVSILFRDSDFQFAFEPVPPLDQPQPSAEVRVPGPRCEDLGFTHLWQYEDTGWLTPHSVCGPYTPRRTCRTCGRVEVELSRGGGVQEWQAVAP